MKRKIRKLDREKYLALASSQGLTAALTALHHEMEKIEQESFEGTQGWQPELWESIKEYRAFSSELWETRDVNEAMGGNPPPPALK